MASDPDVPGESRLPYYVIGAVVALLLATLVVPAFLPPPECWPVKPAGDIRVMGAAVDFYSEMEGRQPRSFEDLIRPGSGGRRYLMCDVVPRDPWGRQYLCWTNVDGTFEIATYGEDGLPGGEGMDKDVTLSKVREWQR